MTTPNNQPTPPEGYRLLTPEEYGYPTPEGTKLWIFDPGVWDPRMANESPTEQPFFYAVPITPTVPSTGDTTNEKGGEPCADTDQAKSHLMPTPASNAALDVRSVEQRPIPKPLFPCKHCYEFHTWPAEDLHWSETEKGWVCLECWDLETHGDHGSSLQEEIDTRK